MTTATDPKTGQSYELGGGRWVPISRVSRTQQRPAAEPEEKLSSGPIESALVGAGDVLNTVGLNARDLWARVTGDQAGQQAIAEERQDAAGVRARLHREAPIAATVGSMLPGLATAPLGGASILGQLATGAGVSAATSASGELGRDAIIGAGLGALGIGGQQIVQRVMGARAAMQNMRAGAQGGTLTAGEREVIEGADRAGMLVTPGQRAGSKAMRDFEAQTATIPGVSVVVNEIKESNRRTLNGLAARAMGIEGADSVSAEVRALAEQQLGEKFERIAQAIGTVNTKPIRAEFGKLAEEEAMQGLPTSAARRLQNLYESGFKGRERAAAGAGEQMTGQMLMQMRSEASSLMRKADAAGDATEGQIYSEGVAIIDDIVHRSALMRAGPEVADAYREARSQWNVLRAANRGGVSVDGNVMPAAMYQKLHAGDQTGTFGRAARDGSGDLAQTRGSGILGQNPTGDFYDALRFARSDVGRDSLPMTGARMGLAMQIGGGTGLALSAARRLAAVPMAKAYAGMSPQGAATAAAMIEAMRSPGAASGVSNVLRQGGV